MITRTRLITLAALVLALSVSRHAHAAPVGVNLIANGDFEAGNTGFSSPYQFVLPSNNDNQYYVLSNPADWYFQFQSFGDHTTGAGRMFLGNGDVNGGIAYVSNVFDVAAGMSYQVFGWFTSLGCSTCTVAYGNSVIDVAMRLNGVRYALAQGITDNAAAGTWRPFDVANWTAPLAGQAQLEISTAPGQWSGNDFALDDLFVSTTPVPEPTSIALLGIGLFGIARRLRRG